MKAIFLVLIFSKCLFAETLYVAGGCFWCMEGAFEKVPGVSEVISGFSGGKEKNPSYEDVAYKRTGHREAVKIIFDPKKVSLAKLLDVFWMNIDPTDLGGQFADRGYHYSTAIYYQGDNQKEEANASLKRLKEKKVFKDKIQTEILAYKNFYAAPENHQDYYKKKPAHYKRYRVGSGREGFLKRVWGK